MNALNMKQRKKMKIRTEEEEQEIMERKPKTICTCGHEEELHHYGKWCEKIIRWDKNKQSTIMGIKGEKGENVFCPCKKFSPQKKQEEE